MFVWFVEKMAGVGVVVPLKWRVASYATGPAKPDREGISTWREPWPLRGSFLGSGRKVERLDEGIRNLLRSERRRD